ncbi:hypothetical protein SM0020_10710 [Sinorhizobium meliloti CCNWSX0020]|uniref:Uncharacterized protein n=1 Tax=Sinorhizobium meliloti CCNWSX0020 TaxID=1107881 RepID=H0FY68_RHIML|nr:hypothetical protein [Sinorhizobium meliloti]PII37896.1 CopG family transcriptional regulator [Sinorhizobium meliloti CCBAU 01290]EHK77922.1 hypothetical protein SM0020_10710 [Sinorhizobium meliloti CCNWSX0020]RVG74784.1 CopG family transcriptional regulator [Sinorhizobium meliloti]RVH36264.1 CopG family transcriptional regulator [Sinorhizobium meliloti]RVH54066.1 CopG family transcriptional regulator [Sinorhizobium meliloti]
MRDEADTRTTLSIDDDVRIAASAMATQQQRSTGEVISELASAFTELPVASAGRTALEIVSALRDELP